MKQQHTKKTCLIGLGQITQRYINGLDESSFLELCAISDINENAVSRKLYNEYPFYPDYKQMLAEEKPDYVVISTPPESHFEIASYCLENGVNIIIEKPVTLCLDHFDELVNLANKKSLVFRTLFHWHGGIETIAFNEKYDVSEIEEIKVSISDPYSADSERINDANRPLMGAWIDSGVNALSMIRQWLPFKELEIVNTETNRCKDTNLPLYAKVSLIIDRVPVEIVIDWRQGKDYKESFVKLDDRWVHIDHSAQRLVDGNPTEYARIPRLDEHYTYLFGTLSDKSNTELSRSVHDFLFKVSDVL